MSKALKKRGFRFVGSTICYAFMQAAGMVNDHTVGCFRHAPAGQADARLENWLFQDRIARLKEVRRVVKC